MKKRGRTTNKTPHMGSRPPLTPTASVQTIYAPKGEEHPTTSQGQSGRGTQHKDETTRKPPTAGLQVPYVITYLKANWKMVLHLLFRTYRFGVNNQWWSPFRSIFGLPIYSRWHLIRQYKGMRFRAEIYFIPREDFIKLFPRYSKKRGYTT